ncbi:polysaccharide pyruvyl transferase family protein [Eggerthella timonensis]|uniref:polysaccharide pyruvyl transferase family protein n=1 Tax=Eggerthella timonensis TaxID=1871008 RepID=UPI0015E0FB64|nr:polysaccharide pyruvyl transferase family protein [Eggerthella timonensis]
MTEHLANRGVVATLTFHEAVNYGAVLQSYALQQAVLKTGVETVLLNYSCDAIQASHYSAGKGIKSKIGWYARSRFRNVKHAKFADFRANRLVLTEPVRKNELRAYCDRFRLVIVGSDQVWNPAITDGDTSYFLDFIDDPERKASYAASLGVKSWPESFRSVGTRLVRDFSFVSVREQGAATYLRSAADVDPCVVCDPVMLLSKEEWERMAIDPRHARPYLLVFGLGRVDADCLQWTRRIADQLGVDVVVLHNGAFALSGVTNVRDAGPEEFLGWIKQASLIITNSFHGSCFSILLEKQFYWFRSAQCSDALKTRESRLEDLLDAFDLRSRQVSSGDALAGPIDYERVTGRLEEYRRASLDFLRRMLRS